MSSATSPLYLLWITSQSISLFLFVSVTERSCHNSNYILFWSVSHVARTVVLTYRYEHENDATPLLVAIYLNSVNSFITVIHKVPQQANGFFICHNFPYIHANITSLPKSHWFLPKCSDHAIPLCRVLPCGMLPLMLLTLQDLRLKYCLPYDLACPNLLSYKPNSLIKISIAFSWSHSRLNHSTSQVVVIACLNSLNFCEHRFLLVLYH